MSCQYRNAHLYQSRSCDGRSDYIVSSGRNAHTKNQGSNHGKEHCRKQCTTGQVEKRSSNFQTYTSFGYYTNDDTCSSTCNQYAKYAHGTINQALYALSKGNTSRRTQACTANAQKDCCQCCTHRGKTANKQVNDYDKRKSQVAFFHEEFFEGRQFFTRSAFQIVFFSFIVNAKPYANVVQECRNNCCFYYVEVRNTYEFSHQECCCTHYRRHQLTTGGSCCFYCTCKFRTVA